MGVILSPIISGSNGKQPARFHTVHNIVVVIHISLRVAQKISAFNIREIESGQLRFIGSPVCKTDYLAARCLVDADFHQFGDVVVIDVN